MFKNTISYIWPIIKKYKLLFYGIFFLQAARLVFSAIATPIIFKRIINLVSNHTPAQVAGGDLYQTILFLAGCLTLAFIFGRSTQFAMARFQSLVINDLHNLSFEKLQGHSYLFFADHFSGALVNKSRKFVRAFEIMHDLLIQNFWSCFVLLVAVFIVFFTEVPMIAFIFLFMAIVYVVMLYFTSKKKLIYDIEEAKADSRVTAYLADAITNILSTKSSSATTREIAGFKEVTEEEGRLRLRAWNYGNRQNAFQSAISMSMQIGVFFLTAKLWLAGSISTGIFVLVQSYSLTIGQYFWDLGMAMTRGTKALSDMKEMVDIMRETPAILDPMKPQKSKIEEGNIEFKNMTFDYGLEEVFKNFNLKIKAGEKVGLVGHSGSGKSTITKLLLRFLDIQDGEILIDGQDIRKITQDNLREKISYIAQEPILFHRTIRENIAYGYPQATEAEIIESAKKAHAHEFITKLMHGYDTLVGERGVKLSGGERQRVAIARAMLKPAPILVLDEATSSLDSVSESYIQDAFGELMKGKTAIVIAHRLSTIQKMDRIVVLDKGKIAEEGTHKELLAKGGIYADLWNHQTGGFLE